MNLLLARKIDPPCAGRLLYGIQMASTKLAEKRKLSVIPALPAGLSDLLPQLTQASSSRRKTTKSQKPGNIASDEASRLPKNSPL
jgi:hypothetical protein